MREVFWVTSRTTSSASTRAVPIAIFHLVLASLTTEREREKLKCRAAFEELSSSTSPKFSSSPRSLTQCGRVLEGKLLEDFHRSRRTKRAQSKFRMRWASILFALTCYGVNAAASFHWATKKAATLSGDKRLKLLRAELQSLPMLAKHNEVIYRVHQGDLSFFPHRP